MAHRKMYHDGLYFRIGRGSAPPPPDQRDVHERHVEEPGGRNDSTEGRAPVAASTAEGSRGLASGSSGLVRWDLGMVDNA